MQLVKRQWKEDEKRAVVGIIKRREREGRNKEGNKAPNIPSPFHKAVSVSVSLTLSLSLVRSSLISIHSIPWGPSKEADQLSTIRTKLTAGHLRVHPFTAAPGYAP